ncbi:MAG: hypothetical protein HYY24_05035 [Verrucomicrobia bacterium]|nr:hypothetical protein [Verrucomicrobiota bacterium]
MRQLFNYFQRLLFLVRDLEQYREDTQELRRELQQTNALVIELSHRLERLAEREQHEREKFMLRVENALLRSERQLPPGKEPKKSR